MGGRHPSRQGRRADLGNIYLRSSWEANWARYLNLRLEQGVIAGWEYEKETFWFPIRRGTVSYLPDFKVTFRGGSVEYHEVKGYMDPKSKTKLRRMAKYHPHIKILVIDRAVYKEMAIAHAHLLEHWEEDGVIRKEGTDGTRQAQVVAPRRNAI
jgi:hypothetical protein